MKGERITLAEIFKQDGIITLDIPNPLDVPSYELYGFLKCYLEILEANLINCIDEDP